MPEPSPMTRPATPPPLDPVQEAAWVSDQRRPHWPATIARFEAASAEVARRPGFTADLVYGDHPRARFDWFASEGEARGLLLYLHPGYWQMRDRTLFRCLMPIFATLGLDVATVGYPLCPDATLAEVTETLRAAVPALLARAKETRGRSLPLIAAGHSAGAHLAVELALTAWRARGLASEPIAGVLALSGIYDLEPLIATSLNAALRLDPATARAASPIHRASRDPAGGPLAPAVFAVGAAETAAFVGQNRAMAAAWRAAGGEANVVESPGDDHFSLIERIGEPTSDLARATAGLVARALPASTDAV